MKYKIIYCDYCKEDTVHLTTKRLGAKRGKFHLRREVKHCTKCNRRTIKNGKTGKTYVK